MKGMLRFLVNTGAFVLVGVVMISASASAMSFSSTDYTIDAAVLNNVGGYSSSSDYQLTSSGGEAAIGNGASGSYKLAAGYVAQIITPQLSLNVQPSGLIAEYPFDEGSGSTAYDGSVNGNNGYTVGNPTWVTGKIGDALSFNGSSQAVNLGTPSTFNTSAGTVEAWVKTTSTASEAIVMDAENTSGITISSGKIVGGVGSSSITGSSTINDGNWHQIAFTFSNGGSCTLYIDGGQQASGTCGTVSTSSSFDSSIGGVVSTSGTYLANGFSGSIDQVKLFNRALSAQEVAAEYNAQNNGVPTGLTLQTIVPGASNTTNFSVYTKMSGSSYTLAINENHDLQNGSSTIPAISGSINSPAAWQEGTTKGLGFTLTNTNATAIPGIWGGGSDYAALPTSPTSFYTRTGTQTSTDELDMQLRADAATAQASGTYSNTMTITGTVSP